MSSGNPSTHSAAVPVEGGKAVLAPVRADGVAWALRTAYVAPKNSVPAELQALIDRLNG